MEAILRRPPNHLELALFAVMWSEHCSYKSSRVHLQRLPTEGPHVLVGPGENAGVIDAGDGIAVAIRIESHNHPSAIEPYQGAATGVGGILRDIFTMGARPIAVMDPLFFGDPTEARQQWLIEGVVAGISGYGNSVGVPTVGGELTFDPCYAQNPLVNVLCMGVLPVDRLVLGQASGVGNLAVLLGSSTGRDGIGGVSVLASAGFGGGARASGGGDAGDEAKRPSVQVGDPYEEKRLIEACLELLDAGLVVGIQDLGGAGLVCATSETAARGGVGMDVDVSAVPRREPGMAPYEVMTSESQERMLAIVTPEDLARVEEVCRRWEVRAAVVGRVTEPPAGGPGPAADPRRLRRRGARRRAGRGPQRGRPALPPADGPARRPRRPGRPTTPGRWPPPTTAGRTSWPCCRTRPGSTASTTTSSSSTRSTARAATPPCSAWPPPGCLRRRRAWPSPPTPTRPGARSTPGPAPRPPWPRAPSTWPAPGPGPWPSSTASTSAIPSTPRSCGSCRRPSTG